MARINRKWDPNCFDHVVMRGNNRQNIFSNKMDIAVLFRTLQYTNTKHPFSLIAYCIMNNHFHLLIRSPEVPLGKVMGLINKQYSNYYKKKYNYTGFLYESRYFARMVPEPGALLSVSAYIHQNPVATKKPIVERMENYPHSSFRLYHRKTDTPYPFLD
ncbi:MAG: transposase, partial [Sporosarcina sp.]